MMDVPELWTAILDRKYELVNEMINRGANINDPVRLGDYEVMLLPYALYMTKDVECIRALLNLGANIHSRNGRLQTPLHWAAAIGAHPDIIELLINEGAIIDARDDYQETPLHRYATVGRGRIETAKKLIDKGASIEAVNSSGLSTLHIALICHNLDLVKVLLNHKVNIDCQDIHGCTPLLRYFETFETMEPNLEIIQLLVDNGADVNAKSRRGKIYPLFYATKFNCLDSVHLLLKCGARIDETTSRGYTALHVACWNGLADVTALLLEFGADLNLCAEESKTPFELLPNNPYTEATAQIIIREAVKREALGQCLCEGYKQMAQSCETYSKFDQECREEVKRMQSEKIEDTVISFFQIIFLTDEDKLVALARNEKIVAALESSGYVESCRIYVGELTELQRKFEVAKKRVNFLTSVENCLNGVLGNAIPAPIVRKIATYVQYDVIIENEL